MKPKKRTPRAQSEDNLDGHLEKEPEGVAEGALHALGRIVPSFGELVKGLEKSEAFQEKLRAANTEIERRLENGTPLEEAEGTRRSNIPRGTAPRRGRGAPEGRPLVQIPERDVIADVFDEGDHLLIIAELPGASETDIDIEVRGTRLFLKAKVDGRQYHKELELPDLVEDKVDSRYRNGILQIIVRKQRK